MSAWSAVVEHGFSLFSTHRCIYAAIIRAVHVCGNCQFGSFSFLLVILRRPICWCDGCQLWILHLIRLYWIFVGILYAAAIIISYMISAIVYAAVAVFSYGVSLLMLAGAIAGGFAI